MMQDVIQCGRAEVRRGICRSSQKDSFDFSLISSEKGVCGVTRSKRSERYDGDGHHILIELNT